jgi:hypothetical protein
MDYLTFKKDKWPVRVSYYALKQYQIETGKGIETLEEDISNLEILLFHSLVAGCRSEDKEITFVKEDMEFMLDESLTEFNKILTGSFPEASGGTDNKKK